MPRHKLRRFREEVVKPFLKAHGQDTALVLGSQQGGVAHEGVREGGEAQPAFVHAVNLEG